jgi:hypothetical protein
MSNYVRKVSIKVDLCHETTPGTSVSSVFASELHKDVAKSYFVSAPGDRSLELELREQKLMDSDTGFTLALRFEAY